MTFNQAKQKYLNTLSQYVPIVARVHGKSHPEFYEVQKVFDIIIEKIKDTKDLTAEFADLQRITDNYTVPADVCESYQAVYEMLAKLNKAYQAEK